MMLMMEIESVEAACLSHRHPNWQITTNLPAASEGGAVTVGRVQAVVVPVDCVSTVEAEAEEEEGEKVKAEQQKRHRCMTHTHKYIPCYVHTYTTRDCEEGCRKGVMMGEEEGQRHRCRCRGGRVIQWQAEIMPGDNYAY